MPITWETTNAWDVGDDPPHHEPGGRVIDMKPGKDGVYEFDKVREVPGSVWDGSTHTNFDGLREILDDSTKYDGATINKEELRKVMDGIGWLLKRGRQ